MSTTVFCTASQSQTETIVRNLQTAGFSGDNISVLLADKQGTRDLEIEHNTKTPEGAATGAGGGAVLGGALGWIAGIGALAIPGIGPFIAAGPILAALSGAAIGGAVGGLTGALIGMGMSEFEAKEYEGKVKAGNALISIHTDNSHDTERATDICERAGVSDVTTSSATAVAGNDRHSDLR
ncbi:MAG: hypothetical protein EA381_04570 [Planctomycetaceae bacterium]|nr:MAG: hypothetical protein EA381_04570 [Planctomycetaceae bacterium]